MTSKPTIATEQVNENTLEPRIMNFGEFVNENFGNPELEDETQPEYMQNEEENPMEDPDNMEQPLDTGYEVDEEQLEALMNEFGDDLSEVIDKIVEGMEIEKEAAVDLICAAIEKICKTEDEDDTPENDDSSVEETPAEETFGA